MLVLVLQCQAIICMLLTTIMPFACLPPFRISPADCMCEYVQTLENNIKLYILPDLHMQGM